METKNTIIAIVLAVIVLVGWNFLFPMNKNNAEQQAQQTVAEETSVEAVESSNAETESVFSSNTSEMTEASEEESGVFEEYKPEEKFTVKTQKAEIVLSNKGGDIVSYVINLNKDGEKLEKNFIQMADNVSDTNRAFALSIGRAEDQIVNDIFDVNKIDDKTYLFTKTYLVNGQKVVFGKKYTFKDDDYMFKLEILVHNESGKGLNKNGFAYTLRTSPQIGTRLDPKDRYDNRQFIVYTGSKNKKTVIPSGQYKQWEKDYKWSGIGGKYFEELIIPTDVSNIKNTYYSSKVETDDYANAQIFYEREAFSGTDINDTYYVYIGPRNEKDVEIYNKAEENSWNLSGLRLTESLNTTGFFSWIEIILKWALELLHKGISNWGICIILLTLILKLLLFPLSKKQSLGTLKMQKLQPQMKAIQTKYANDQQKQQAAMAQLYKEAGYNPASGCLPMIFQIIILWAMYNLFNNYYEFRGANFITGWISDLSKGDVIWSWEKNIFLISGFTGNTIRLLPVIYVITQLISGKITQTMGAGQTNGSMKFMTYGMPLIFFFVFYSAPSGLLLYWLTSNILQIVQQIVINKIMAEKKQEMGLATNTQKTIPPKAKNKKSK